MAALGNSFINSVFKLVFQGTTITGLADNTATSPLTNLYVALHTSTPGATGNQQTNEAAYTSYTRATVARTSSGWTVASAESESPVNDIVFPLATGGSETETYFSVGTTLSSTGVILWFGPITPNIVVSTGVTPTLAQATAMTLS